MARVLRGFAPEPPVVFVIQGKAKYLKLFLLRLTPQLNPQPYGTQFHSTQLRFVGSASILKERKKKNKRYELIPLFLFP